MTNSMRNIMMIISTLFFYIQVRGQANIPKYELGLGLSGFIYQGDLAAERLGSFRTMRIGVNLFGSKIMSPSFSLRTNLAIGGLRGNDALYATPEYRRQRNFNFRSRVIELSELLAWNLLGKNYDDKGFSPYLFAGAGLSFLRVRRDYSKYNPEYFNALGSDVTSRLAEDAQHEPPKVIPVIPVGAGLRYNLSSTWAVMAESAYRLTYTDYIDGFSKAANPKLNDHYHTTTIGLVYRIGKQNRLGCPAVRY